MATPVSNSVTLSRYSSATSVVLVLCLLGYGYFVQQGRPKYALFVSLLCTGILGVSVLSLLNRLSNQAASFLLRPDITPSDVNNYDIELAWGWPFPVIGVGILVGATLIGLQRTTLRLVVLSIIPLTIGLLITSMLYFNFVNSEFRESSDLQGSRVIGQRMQAESLALNTIKLLIDRSLGFYNRNFYLSESWENLGIGSSRQTESYSYRIATDGNFRSIFYANSRLSDLKSFSGMLMIVEAQRNKLAKSIVCQTSVPSTVAPVVVVNGEELYCAQPSVVVPE